MKERKNNFSSQLSLGESENHLGFKKSRNLGNGIFSLSLSYHEIYWETSLNYLALSIKLMLNIGYIILFLQFLDQVLFFALVFLQYGRNGGDSGGIVFLIERMNSLFK
jgi:hypothetical protein